MSFLDELNNGLAKVTDFRNRVDAAINTPTVVKVAAPATVVTLQGAPAQAVGYAGWSLEKKLGAGAIGLLLAVLVYKAVK